MPYECVADCSLLLIRKAYSSRRMSKKLKELLFM